MLSLTKAEKPTFKKQVLAAKTTYNTVVNTIVPENKRKRNELEKERKNANTHIAKNQLTKGNFYKKILKF